MSLILTLTDQENQSRRETRTLSRGSLAIGRNPDNAAGGERWVLEDPTRQVSKTHCIVSIEGGRLVLEDRSTNGVYVNGSSTPTTTDSRVALQDGDEFRLGRYTISVRQAAVPGASPAAADPFGFERTQVAAAKPAFGGAGTGIPDPLGGDPFDDPFNVPQPQRPFVHPIAAPQPQLRSDDPFDLAEGARGARLDPDDDLFRPRPPSETWTGTAQRDDVDAPRLAFTPPKPLAARRFDVADIDALLGDDPIAGVHTPAQPSAAVPPPARTTPFGQTGPADLDDLLGDDPLLGPPSPARPPAPQPPAPQPPAPPAPVAAAPPATPSLDDLLGDDPFGEPSAVSAPRPVPAPVVVPAPVQPAPAVAAVPPVAQPSAAQPSAAQPSAAGAAALLAAFLEGAGMADLKLGDRQPEAVMRAAGEVFRIMVEGLRDVLMSRAAIKNELRVEQTVLRARDNNALKFSITPEDAVAALLVPDRPGYKPPVAAAREAFDDIKSHELAVMAGVQTALLGLLKRFDPATLETRLQPGALESILPAARKARYWEAFCATYKELAREAEDDFQSVFGREFARAYDAQSQKL
jgi:type VI secretion system FHA domain protein